MNKILALVNALMAILGLIGVVAGVFWFMENRHMLRSDDSLQTVDLKQEILEGDIKEDAESLYHYKKKRDIGTADPADIERLKYLESRLEKKYDKQEKLQELEDELQRETN